MTTVGVSAVTGEGMDEFFKVSRVMSWLQAAWMSAIDAKVWGCRECVEVSLGTAGVVRESVLRTAGSVLDCCAHFVSDCFVGKYRCLLTAASTDTLNCCIAAGLMLGCVASGCDEVC